MSRNFDLMRRVYRNAEILEPRIDERLVWSRPTESADTSQSKWIAGLGVLGKHWRLSAIFAGVVFLAVALATFLMKSTYEPEAQIEIEVPGSEAFSLQEGGSAPSDPEYLATQAQKLKSNELALETIRTLRLDRNPEFAGSFVNDTEAPLVRDSNAPQLSKAQNAALRTFRDRLAVRRESSSRLITVSFASQDPTLAANITNTLVRLFVEDSYRSRHDAIMQSSEWLARQLDDIRQNMEKSNQALAKFQKATGIADLGENNSTFSLQVGELNRQLSLAQADRIQMESFLGRLKSNGPESLPHIGANPVVQQLTQKLADVRAELATSRAIYGKNHPNIKKLQNEADELEAQLSSQRGTIVAELGTSYAAARARERLLSGQVRGTTKELNEMAQFNALKKEAEANAQLYSSLYARVKEAGISAASKSSNIRIVNRARVLDQPSRPHRALNIAIGLLFAIVGGVALAFIREHFDSGIYTPEDVRKYTGLSSVAVMPAIRDDDSSGPMSRIRSVLLPGQVHGGEPCNFFLEKPRSPEAEALRAIHSSIMLSRDGVPARVLLVVSAFPSEGKTTLAVNLSSALALHGTTCIVDADLRKPDVGKTLKLPRSHGVTDVLSGLFSVDEALIRSPHIKNLSILQAGLAQPDLEQLQWSEKARELISGLRRRFDFLIIDTPPILPYADARALAPIVDGVILVGRAGVTTRDAMMRSLELLSQVHSAPVVQIVLNAVNPFSLDCRYYYRGYS